MEKTCKNCGQQIHHISGKIWHDKSDIFPQYCMAMHGGDLHEPEDESDKELDNQQ